MKSKRHSSFSMRFGLLVLAAISLSFPRFCNAQAPVPTQYQDLYTSLGSYLDSFNATINASWNGSKPPVPFAANLGLANANLGPQVIQKMPGITLQLQAIKAMGVQAVVVQCGFPMLYAPYYDEQSVYQQYVTFYSQVAALVRANGLKLIVENESLLSNSASSGWTGLSQYYATLDWTQFQQARAQDAATVAQIMQPDYLILLEEPASEAMQTGQTSENDPNLTAGFVSQMLTSVQQVPVPGIKVGAGVAPWQPDLSEYVGNFAALPLDFINLHIFPVNFNFLPNVLTIQSIAASAGKPISVSEAWMWKMRDSEWNVLTADQIRSRNPYSFWQPLDVYFQQTMENLAYYTNMAFMAMEGPDYYSAYLDYNTINPNLTPGQVLSQEDAAADAGFQNASFTGTAMAYYSSLVFPPDTVAPSAPTALAGSASSNSIVNLSWSGSTDNVGVAGYYVSRNGGQAVFTTGQTTFQDTGLANATTYSYVVTAFDLAGNVSTPSQTINVTTLNGVPPSPPSNVVAVAASCQQVNLSWTPPSGGPPVSGYLLLRGDDPADMAVLWKLSNRTTSFHNASLTPGTTYYYAVQTTSQTYISAMSPIVQVTTMAPPSAPTNLAATPTSTTNISLTWTASTGGMAIGSYHIFRGLTASSLVQIGTSTKATYNDTTGSASTTYYYQVQALDKGGDLSPMSALASATTMGGPSAPSNLVATATAATKVSLTWSASSGNLPITSYHVFRGTSPSTLASLTTRTTTSYTDTTVSPATTYYYAVQATDKGGDLSPMSGIVSVTTPPMPLAPTNLVATATSATTVSLTWTAPTGGLPIASYHVYRGPSAANLSDVGTKTSNSDTDKSLTPGTTYYYGVMAIDTGGDQSPMSQVVMVTTMALPSAPTSLTATPVSNSQVSLAWSASSGQMPISNYRVFRGTSPNALSQITIRTTTTYSDNAVSPATTYYYGVEAVDSAGDISPMSPLVTATTPN